MRSRCAAVCCSARSRSRAPRERPFWWCKSTRSGILTRTLVAAVALIDVIAVGVFVFMTSYLAATGNGDGSWHDSWQLAVFSVAHELALAFGVGTSVLRWRWA